MVHVHANVAACLLEFAGLWANFVQGEVEAFRVDAGSLWLCWLWGRE